MADADESKADALWRKLGLPKAGAVRVVLCGAPASFELVENERAQVHRERFAHLGTDPATLIVAFFEHASSIAPALDVLAPRVHPSGAIWVAWPRRAGGHESDITDNVVSAAVGERGLVDVKVAALDEDWSGLRFVWRRERRS